MTSPLDQVPKAGAQAEPATADLGKRGRMAGGGAQVLSYVKSGALLGGSRLIPVVVGLASFPLLTKLLPTAEYGRLSLISSVVNIATVATGSWLASAIIRYYSRSVIAGESAGLDGWIFLRALPWNIVASVLIVGGTFLFYPVGGLLVAIACVLAASQPAYSLLNAVLQARLEFRIAFWMEAAKGAVYVLMLLAFVVGLRGGVAGAVLASAGAAVLVAVVLGWRMRLHRVVPASGYASKFLAYGMPMAASSLCAWVLQLSDRWFLLNYRGEATVGTYAANYSLIENLVRNPVQIALMLVSILAFRKSESSGQHLALSRVFALRPYFAGLSLTLAVLAIAIANPALSLLATPAYFQPRALQGALAFGQVLQLVAMYEGITLQIRGKTHGILTAAVIAALTNVVANFVLIPHHGAFGAALATAVSYGVLAMATLFISARASGSIE